MKRLLLTFVVFIFFLSACASPTPPIASDEATQISENTDFTPPEVNVSPTTVEIQIQERTNPEPIALATETAMPTLMPSNTPMPEANRWHWAFKPETSEIFVVNESGERNSIGEINLMDFDNYRLLAVSDEQVLLFTFSQNKPGIYLLDLKEIQKIKLPSSFYYDENLFINTLRLVGVADNKAYFMFSTEQGYQTDRNYYPEKGPIYKIDLLSKEISLVDEKVYHEPYYDNRLFFLQSKDGLFKRYFSTDTNNLLVRELNLGTGESRTITTSTDSPTRVNSSIHGDVFHLTNSNVIVDVEGENETIPESEYALRLLRGGEAVNYPKNCLGPCDLEIIDPMTNKILHRYTLPWVAQSFIRLGTQLLPNQNILWIGASSNQLLDVPATRKDFPEMNDVDFPVFLLSEEKPAEWIGIFSNEFLDFFQYPISDDGRYILLKSISGSHYFIYDAYENLELFSLPIKEGWDYFYGDVRFHAEGILIHFLASNSDKEYIDFYSVHNFGQTGSVYWEDQEGEILSCPDLFADGTISCWIQRPDTNYDLVRFEPGTEKFRYLIENVFVLESFN